MKRLKDIKVGDTVWVYDTSGGPEKFTVTYIEGFNPNHPLSYNYRIGYDRYGSKPKSYYESVQASNTLESTTTSFGMYAAAVYFNKEDVIERINRDIKSLEKYKQKLIEDSEL